MKFCYSFSRILSVLTLVVLLGVGAQAQRKAPGYMGKRFLLKYDQGISWSLGGDARGIPNLFYTLQGDLAVTTKFSVGAEYSFMTRKYGKRLGQPENFYYTATDKNYRLDRVYMHRVGIYTKMFSQRNGHIAPAGPYFLTGLNLYFVDGHYSSFVNSSYSGKGFQQKRLSFDFGPTIGGGKQYIIANRMVISLDLRISIPLIGLARTFNREAGLDSNGGEKTKLQMVNHSMDRWTLWTNTQANFIELRMGLGTLL